MQVEQELAGYSQNRDSMVTIGVFDGVHLGHKYLISQLKELARKQDLLSVVITFHKHPQEVLSPQVQPPFLTDASEKSLLLRNEGVDSVIVLTFTPKLAQINAPDFLTLLKIKLRMKGLVIGPDFALGRNAQGNVPTIRQLGKEMGFSVTVIPPVRINGDVVSSTAIRHAMSIGDMEKVQRFMGRPFSLHGRVIHGKGRGTGLGFPTVNLEIAPGQAVPAEGVYATLAHADNKTFTSVTNVGTNPTFGDSGLSIESYLLDYHNNLYEHDVKIDFISRIREEIKFKDTQGLIEQISKDIQEARNILKLKASIKNG